MKQNRFCFHKRMASFKHALNGLKILIHEEHNARIHVVAVILVIVLSIGFQIDKYEWVIILLCISVVVSTEIINSAIENICDFICSEKHRQIKKIKDLSAAAVLLSACVSFIIACLIFIPKLQLLVR